MCWGALFRRMVGFLGVGAADNSYEDREHNRDPHGRELELPAVTLTETNVERAKKRETNFSGLLDRLLARWLKARS
jgi:hypothetical protein